jgi:AcrR family transcriptional regulator
MTTMTPSSLNGAPTTRRERRRREVHERIVEAAIGLFERKGFAGTTALEIADTADIAEKTFYNHFPTKQHLIQELAESSVKDTARLVDEALEHAGSTADRLRHFFERSADSALRGSRELTREVLLELVRVAQVDGAGPGGNRHLNEAFARMFAEGRARGDVSPDRDVAFLAELVLAAWLGIVINWVTVPDYPIRERLTSLADLVANDIAGQRTPSTAKVR